MKNNEQNKIFKLKNSQTILRYYQIPFEIDSIHMHQQIEHCSIKKLFLEISENLQKNIFARVLYHIDKNWYHFVKEYLEQFSKFAYQKVARPVRRSNRHILRVLLACRHTLVTQNRQVSVRLQHWDTIVLHKKTLIFATFRRESMTLHWNILFLLHLKKTTALPEKILTLNNCYF